MGSLGWGGFPGAPWSLVPLGVMSSGFWGGCKGGSGAWGWKMGGGRMGPQARVWAAGGTETEVGGRPVKAADLSPLPAFHGPAPAMLQAPRPRRCHPRAGTRASRGGRGRACGFHSSTPGVFHRHLPPCSRRLPVVFLWAEGAQGRARPSSFGAEELPGPAQNPRDLTGTPGGP